VLLPSGRSRSDQFALGPRNPLRGGCSRKHEPANDIDSVVVDSLKVLDPNRLGLQRALCRERLGHVPGKNGSAPEGARNPKSEVVVTVTRDTLIAQRRSDIPRSGIPGTTTTNTVILFARCGPSRTISGCSDIV